MRKASAIGEHPVTNGPQRLVPDRLMMELMVAVGKHAPTFRTRHQVKPLLRALNGDNAIAGPAQQEHRDSERLGSREQCGAGTG